MSNFEELMVEVSKFLQDQLTKETLSAESEKFRKILLERIGEVKSAREANVILRRKSKRQSRAKESKDRSLLCDNYEPVEVSLRDSKISLDQKKTANEISEPRKETSHEDSGSETDYESMEDLSSISSLIEEKKTDVKITSSKQSSIKSKKNSTSSYPAPVPPAVEKCYEGYLYRKGKLNTWKKLYCYLAGDTMVCCPDSKDTKHNKIIKLAGYDIYGQKCKESSKYDNEIRLVGPGLRTRVFYAKEKFDADLWVMELSKASKKLEKGVDEVDCLIALGEKDHCSSIKERDEFEDLEALTAAINNNNNNASSCSLNTHNNQSNSNSCNNIDSQSTGSGMVRKSKIQTLIAKVKNKARMAFETTENLSDKQVSGLLNISYDDLAKGGWSQRFCTIRSGHLEIFKVGGGGGTEERPEILLSLPGMNLTLIPSSDSFFLCLNQSGQKVFIKFNSHTELNKWYQCLQKESSTFDKATKDGQLDSMLDFSLYAEIGETQVGDGDKTKRPALPELPAPETPDILGLLMNLQESQYMDAIECREPLKQKARSTVSAYEDVNVYINRDNDTRLEANGLYDVVEAHVITVLTAPASNDSAAAVSTTHAAGGMESGMQPHYFSMSSGRNDCASSTTTASKCATNFKTKNRSTTSTSKIATKTSSKIATSTSKAATDNSSEVAGTTKSEVEKNTSSKIATTTVKVATENPSEAAAATTSKTAVVTTSSTTTTTTSKTAAALTNSTSKASTPPGITFKTKNAAASSTNESTEATTARTSSAAKLNLNSSSSFLTTTATTKTAAAARRANSSVYGTPLSHSSRATSTSKTPQMAVANKWSTPIYNLVSAEASNKAQQDSSKTEAAAFANCVLRHSNSNPSSSDKRDSLHVIDGNSPSGSKRNSEISAGKSHLIQEKMKIFQGGC